LKRKLALFLIAAVALGAQGPGQVLLVVNSQSPVSRQIGEYYALRRGIPSPNRCVISTPPVEEIDREAYDRDIASPIAAHLRRNGLVDTVLYIVTTLGVPLKIRGSSGADGEQAAVDSELTLLYQAVKGKRPPLAGGVPNPLFGRQQALFRHPQFPIYLVTRLAAYDLDGVKRMIDRSLTATNRGVVVLDLKSGGDEPGDDWLRHTALFLPSARVLLEETPQPVYGAREVIGYASWGSNDPNRKSRRLGFEWLPGAIATEYVSSNGRTFSRPPDSWSFSNDWGLTGRSNHWAGSPQSLTADLIEEGATGASGHVYEPFLARTPRPDYLFPAYLGGRNLAESFYVSIPYLSWMNIVVGDPFCRLAAPGAGSTPNVRR